MATNLRCSETTEKVIQIFFSVYNELGFGFLESVYEEAMAIALVEAGLGIERQVPTPVWFRGRQIGDFRADILVNKVVLLELKAVRAIELAFEKQLLNYLRATQIEVGLLLNFGSKPEFRRFAFDNQRKLNRVYPRVSAAKASL
ncbi:MAG: GxxExxY protein [Acidobacteriales bacterium]|nr:GxxExxY protein [Terriglobales bacterium]